MISRETLSAGGGYTGILRDGGGRPEDFVIQDPAFIPGGEDAAARAMATCLADQVSAKQVQIVKSLAREARLDENVLSWSMFDCDFSELSKQAAEIIIAHLSEAADSFNACRRIRLAG